MSILPVNDTVVNLSNMSIYAYLIGTSRMLVLWILILALSLLAYIVKKEIDKHYEEKDK